MSRTFLSCLAVFIAALYVFFDPDFSTGVRFTAAAVVFVLTCAGFGALCGELFSRGWDALNSARDSHAIRPQDVKKHPRPPKTTPGDRL